MDCFVWFIFLGKEDNKILSNKWNDREKRFKHHDKTHLFLLFVAKISIMIAVNVENLITVIGLYVHIFVSNLFLMHAMIFSSSEIYASITQL